MSKYPGSQDRRSLEYRLEDLERKINRPGVQVVRTVYANTSQIRASTPVQSTDVDLHVLSADPHPQYLLESEAVLLEGRVTQNEVDIAALDARVTAAEASLQDLLDSQPRTLVPTGEIFLIPADRQVAVYGTLTVEGEVTGNGELVVHG